VGILILGKRDTFADHTCFAEAYGIFQIPHPWLKRWQLLFLIEGSITCLLALVALAWLPSNPETAWFLTREERRMIRKFRPTRREADIETECEEDAESGPGPSSNAAGPRDASVPTQSMKLTRRDFAETARDWKLWFVLVFNICASVPSTAFSVFLPLVVQAMGYESLRANLMSVPPYVCGAAGLYLFALHSDYRRERGYHIVTGIMISILGLIGILAASTNGARYAALCVLLSGSYIAPPLTAAWLTGNTPAPGKRALVLGVNGWGNLAGVVGAVLYRDDSNRSHKSDTPYRTALLATLGLVAAALAGYLAYRFKLQRVNQRRTKVMQTKTAAEIELEKTDVGPKAPRYADRKWTFVYGL